MRYRVRLDWAIVLVLGLAACGTTPGTNGADGSTLDDSGPGAGDATIGPGGPDATMGPDAGWTDVGDPSDSGSSRVAVVTGYNDNARTGANLLETTLNVSNVGSNRFGLVFARNVDGQIYAQPLYVSGVDVPGRGRHNIVFVATEHNSVFAFDADDPAASSPLWTVNLGPSVPSADVGDPAPCPDLQPEIGITATPVIDLARSVIYVEAKTKEGSDYFHRLHALDLATGTERLGGPTVINATMPGSGSGSENGMVSFDALHEHARPAMLLSNGVVYMAYASHCDREPYHGWVLAYDAATLQPRAAYNTTREGSNGGIWQSGGGLAADDAGDVYFTTGNGTFDETAAHPQLSDSFVRVHLAGNSLEAADWFTPFNQAALDADDFDLGSTGILLIPGTNLLLGGSKEGIVYVMPRDHMGHFHAGDNSHIPQALQATADMRYSHIHGSPIYWNGPRGPTIYLWGEEDVLRAFRFNGAMFDRTPMMLSTVGAPQRSMPGGILSISADGNRAGTGVLWASLPVFGDANMMIVRGVVRAFDASDLTHELWNSETNPGDSIGLFAKFTPMTVANGHVYAASFSNKLLVYGLRN